MEDSEAIRIAAEKANDWGSPVHVHALAMLALTGVGIYLCYWMTVPFIPALAWALALAVLCAPLNRWLERKFKGRNLAAIVCVIASAVIVVVPAMFVADRIAGEAGKGATMVTALAKSGEWRRSIEGHPRIESIVAWVDEEIDLPGVVQSGAAWLTTTATNFVRLSILHLVGMFLTFYLLFYFLRDRGEALASLRALSPLLAADMNRLFVDVHETVHATVYGTFVVAAVQGLLGGLMFWWLGLPSPMLWGLVMGLLAVIPVLGAFIIWIPAALFLFATGSEGKALVLALWGTIVVGGIDNILYPLLVGNSLKMHTIIAFVSIVGGMLFFGAAGLILGPVVFTVTRGLLHIWRSRNALAET